MASSCTYYLTKCGSTSLCDQSCGVQPADRQTDRQTDGTWTDKSLKSEGHKILSNYYIFYFKTVINSGPIEFTTLVWWLCLTQPSDQQSPNFFLDIDNVSHWILLDIFWPCCLQGSQFLYGSLSIYFGSLAIGYGHLTFDYRPCDILCGHTDFVFRYSDILFGVSYIVFRCFYIKDVLPLLTSMELSKQIVIAFRFWTYWHRFRAYFIISIQQLITPYGIVFGLNNIDL